MQETRIQSLGQEDPLDKWLPTPIFLPGEFRRQKSLAGYRLWGCKELDTTEWLTHFALNIYNTTLNIFILLDIPGSSAGKESSCNAGDPSSILVGKIPWRRVRLPTPVFLGFPDVSDGKESACNMGDLNSILELGRSLGGGHEHQLQYSCLENTHGQKSLAG